MLIVSHCGCSILFKLLKHPLRQRKREDVYKLAGRTTSMKLKYSLLHKSFSFLTQHLFTVTTKHSIKAVSASEKKKKRKKLPPLSKHLMKSLIEWGQISRTHIITRATQKKQKKQQGMFCLKRTRLPAA